MLLNKEKYKTFFILESYFLEYKSVLKFKKFFGLCFQKYKNSFLLRNYEEFFGGFHSVKYKKLSRGGFFFFLAGKMASWNIRRFFRVSISWNIRNLLMLEPESSISWKYDNFFSAFFSVFGVRRVTSWNIREI